jgi:hypothetical protein
VDEYKHRLEATLASIYVKPEDTTTEDKIYDAISIEYTKNLIKHMQSERDKYKRIADELKDKT